MKKLLLLVFLFSGMALAQETPCMLVHDENGQRHYQCTFGDGIVNLLDLHGSLKEMAFYHGKYLWREAQMGVFRGMQVPFEQTLARMTIKERIIFDILYRGIMGKMKSSLTEEFIAMNRGLFEGVQAGGWKGITEDELLENNLLIEFSIVFDGIRRNFERSTVKTIIDIVGGPFSLLRGIPRANILKMMAKLSPIKFGCTGISVSHEDSPEGEFILGRNFDTTLLGSFEKYPVVLLSRPDDGYASVGLAAAGIPYGAGITGMNEKGIVLSLHELSTTHYRKSYPRRNAMVASHLALHVLTHASSIDEAVDIVKSIGSFGAWTILIGDEKTDEFASIEISGDEVSVARKSISAGLAQSNHYISPEISKYGYEPSFGKFLETRARFNLVSEILERERGTIDTGRVMEILAGRTDWFQGRRSFGRTVSKVYTSVSHVMVPSSNEVWFTFGNTYPTNLSPFRGFKIDFEKKEGPFFEFIGDRSVDLTREGAPLPWIESFSYYTQAYLDFDKNGSSMADVIQKMNLAIEKASAAGITEFPYLFMKARLLMKHASADSSLGEESKRSLSEAIEILDLLISGGKEGKVNLHRYEEFQLLLWKARCLDLLDKKKSARDFYRQALVINDELLEEFDGEENLKTLRDSYVGFFRFIPYTIDMLTSDRLDFVTIE